MYSRWVHEGVESFYHAAEDQVHFLGSKAARKKLNIIEEYELDITEEQFKQIYRYAHKRAGTKYAKKQLVGMLLQRVFGLPSNPFADGNKSAVCTEEQGYILTHILGFDLQGDLEVVGIEFMRRWCRDNLKKRDCTDGY